ncbi:MAG: hypothetical protein Q4A15_07955 [Prevotellaceae bacterium]|nr:hypothetical protein [Prevotellaceae bacterium]
MEKKVFKAIMTDSELIDRVRDLAANVADLPNYSKLTFDMTICPEQIKFQIWYWSAIGDLVATNWITGRVVAKTSRFVKSHWLEPDIESLRCGLLERLDEKLYEI